MTVLIVYGVSCTWWDAIEKAGTTPIPKQEHGLPSCPFCGSMLYQQDEVSWFANAVKHEEKGNPGYMAKLDFGRGKCFQSFGLLTAAFERSKS